jgi:MSHA pilin protein MshC
MKVRSDGYSLIELVITIIVIGILSAVVGGNISAKDQHNLTTLADELRRNLSHVQLMAISKSTRLRLTVDAAGKTYTVFSCNNAACTVPSTLIDPATGTSFFVDITKNDPGVTFTSGANSNLDFDSLGRPQQASSLITAAFTYTISGGGRSVSISVLPITGFAS